eukprot:90640-Hanusia_phi.AAC.6
MPSKASCLVGGGEGVEGLLYLLESGTGERGVAGSEEELTVRAGTAVTGKIRGLKEGEYAIKIHAVSARPLGDISNGAKSCGKVYNPGDESLRSCEAGDLGRFVAGRAGSNGVLEVNVVNNRIPLSGNFNIIGRAVSSKSACRSVKLNLAPHQMIVHGREASSIEPRGPCLYFPPPPHRSHAGLAWGIIGIADE